MTEEQIFDKVKKIIVEHLECEESEVTPQAKLGNDLGADSLDYVGMVMEAEKAFGIFIPDEQTYFKDTITVQECCKELEKLINK